MLNYERIFLDLYPCEPSIDTTLIMPVETHDHIIVLVIYAISKLFALGRSATPHICALYFYPSVYALVERHLKSIVALSVSHNIMFDDLL